jgi:hypothetical protein
MVGAASAATHMSDARMIVPTAACMLTESHSDAGGETSHLTSVGASESHCLAGTGGTCGHGSRR